jgi:mono/diheme cytochrome c family protein
MKPDRKNNQPPRSASGNERRETGDPVVGSQPVPVSFYIVLIVLIFLSFSFLEQHAGGFNAKVYPPYDSTKQLEALAPKSEGGRVLEQGREVFAKSCQLCHQPTGMGTPGAFPPLVGSEWVLAPNPSRIIRIVLNGVQGPIDVKGTPWNAAMVPWRDTFKDDEIAAVITYVRNEWGNKAPAVKPEEVKAIRDATKDKSDAWTADELLKISDQ